MALVIAGVSLMLLSARCSSTGDAAHTAYADMGTTAEISKKSLSFLEQFQQANREVVNAALPSVVTLDVVETRTVQQNQNQGLPWFFFGQPDGDAEKEYKAQGLGSGVIVRKTGNTYYVLTNQHVVGKATEIMVRLYDGTEITATLVGGDSRKDIALVSFESKNELQVARLGDSNTVQVGDLMFAIGSPLGFVSSVTQGIVSAVGRMGGPDNNINDFIQTDAAINQGNSGGPLVNIYGEVVGINSWIASSSGGSQGLGFSIPINNVKKAIDDFILDGKISYGWLGVQLVNADKDFLKDLGVSNSKGALAVEVFLNSPADKGGIKPGDFVTALNGKPVESLNQLVLDVGNLRAGETAEFKIVRDGKAITVTAKIEQRDETVVGDSTHLWPGFIPQTINDELRKKLELAAGQQGIVATNIQTKTAAAAMGLQAGDVITAVNDVPVRSLRDFYRELNSAERELWFSILRDGRTFSTIRYTF